MVTVGRRYRILGTIGKGGFGTVYKAELIGESGFSKIVALKVLNADVSGVEEVALRLRDEARVLGLVHHRAIVQVDSLAQLDDRWTIVMECIAGVDLKAVVEDGAIPPKVALEIIQEVAGALHQAWVQPGPDGQPLCLLHRDIKLSNIQLTAAGEVKVLDFGTARANFATREAKTQALAFGTLAYMSPERLDFVDLPAGDVYALGVVLFELLTGSSLGTTSANPAKHEKLLDTAEKRLDENGVPEEIIALVLDTMSFDADHRPTPRELRRLCRSMVSDLPGEWLSDWCATKVPELMDKRGGTSTDEMTGAVLAEQSGTRRIDPSKQAQGDTGVLEPEEAQGEQPRVAESETVWVHTQQPAKKPLRSADTPLPSPPPVPETLQAATATPVPAPMASPPPIAQPAPQRRRGQGGLVAVALAAFVLTAGSVGAGAWWFLSDQPAGMTGEEGTEQTTWTPIQDTAPELDGEGGEQGLADEAEVEDAVEVAALPATTTKPPPVVTPPVDTVRPPSTPAMGTVNVEGDATSVQLVMGGRLRSPGRVPAGTYDIEATFEGRGSVSAGTITIPEGGTVTLICRRAFARCTPK